jgi:AcrR family transcriptional regulator
MVPRNRVCCWSRLALDTQCTEWYTGCLMDDNRSRLLDCALDLFSARGFDAVGVQEVADAAGLKKPTLYHYFGSKSGLLRTLLDEHFEELFNALEPASTYHRDITTTLQAITTEYFKFAQKYPKFYRMQLSMWFSPLESNAYNAIHLINRKQLLLLEAFFKRAAQDHGNMAGRHQAYAATYMGMLNTYISINLHGMAILNDDLNQKAVHQFMHGIFS